MSDETEQPADLGFSPAVPTTGAETADDVRPEASPRPRSVGRTPRRSLRRRLAGGLALIVALLAMGGAYALFAGSSGAADNAAAQADINQGRTLYETSCITCHGANLQGVQGRGVPIVGSGSASVYFQVSTGRMPVAQQGAEISRKPPKYNETQIDQLSAYIQSVGGGPTTPDGNLRQSNVSLGDGGELFRLNCASCHGATGGGAPLSAGKVAPGLHEATDKQIYTAMLSGPESMPVFNDNQLSPDQKKSIINYIQTLKASADPGGSGLARIGPVSEGVVIWVVGIGAVVIAILWIGAKS